MFDNFDNIFFITSEFVTRRERGSNSTVAASWTAGQQVEQSILHLGHVSYQNISLGQVVPGPVQCRIVPYIMKRETTVQEFDPRYTRLLF